MTNAEAGPIGGRIMYCEPLQKLPPGGMFFVRGIDQPGQEFGEGKVGQRNRGISHRPKRTDRITVFVAERSEMKKHLMTAFRSPVLKDCSKSKW